MGHGTPRRPSHRGIVFPYLPRRREAQRGAGLRDDAFEKVQIPIYLEAIRLCGSGKDDITEGEGLQGDILASKYGRRRVEEGKDNGTLAVDPAYGGPYWERIRTYFEA